MLACTQKLAVSFTAISSRSINSLKSSSCLRSNIINCSKSGQPFNRFLSTSIQPTSSPSENPIFDTQFKCKNSDGILYYYEDPRFPDKFETSKTDLVTYLQRREISLVRNGHEDVPVFHTGSIVSVTYKDTMDGASPATYKLLGVVIKKSKGTLLGASFTIRNVFDDFPTEFTFTAHSPRIERIEVLRADKYPRNNMHFLRDIPAKKSLVTIKNLGGLKEQDVVNKYENEIKTYQRAVLRSEIAHAKALAAALDVAEPNKNELENQRVLMTDLNRSAAIVFRCLEIAETQLNAEAAEAAKVTTTTTTTTTTTPTTPATPATVIPTKPKTREELIVERAIELTKLVQLNDFEIINTKDTKPTGAVTSENESEGENNEKSEKTNTAENAENDLKNEKLVKSAQATLQTVLSVLRDGKHEKAHPSVRVVVASLLSQRTAEIQKVQPEKAIQEAYDEILSTNMVQLPAPPSKKFFEGFKQKKKKHKKNKKKAKAKAKK